jgi:arylsulfatase A-like enzyme
VASFADWFATAAQLANAKVDVPPDSLSFVPELRGDPQQTHEFLYWEFHERDFIQAALYQGRWKGLRSGAPDAPVVLFDQQEDAAEKHNVADQYPDIAAKISRYLTGARSDAPDWPPRWRQRIP